MTTKRKKAVIVIPHKYVEAVELGVKWLDLTFGQKEWLRRMDMSDFDITDGNVCVAGNVFKDAFFEQNEEIDSDGYEQFRDVMRRLGEKEDLGIRFGFYTDSDKGMQYLQDLWVRKIKTLKKSRHVK